MLTISLITAGTDLASGCSSNVSTFLKKYKTGTHYDDSPADRIGGSIHLPRLRFTQTRKNFNPKRIGP